MMMQPDVTIASDSVVLALSRMGFDVFDGARRVVREFGLDVTAGAKRNARVKTGRMRRSINGRYTEDSNSATGVVGPNVDYARRIEQGFKGSENVKAFTRMQSMAWGRNIAPRMVNVRAFTRNVDSPAHPYLVPAFEGVRPTFRERLATMMAGVKAKR